MPLIAVYDACVLYPSTLRSFLLWMANVELVHARWTDRILDEAFGNLIRDRPDLDPRRLARTRSLMNAAVEEALVEGYEPLIDQIELPDPDDRHVVAAAIKSHATVIVTANLRDFPGDVLAAWKTQAMSPDEFTLHLMASRLPDVVRALQEMAAGLRNPPATVVDVLDQLERDGLVQSAHRLRTHLS